MFYGIILTFVDSAESQYVVAVTGVLREETGEKSC